MDELKLKEQLKTAVENSAPNDIEDVFRRIEQQKELSQKREKKTISYRKKIMQWSTVVAASLVLVVGAGGVIPRILNHTQTVQAEVYTVTIENPSLELQVTQDNVVESITSEDAAAQEILTSLEASVQGMQLEDAISLLLEHLEENGYIIQNDTATSILIEGEDEQIGTAICANLEDSFHGYFQRTERESIAVHAEFREIGADSTPVNESERSEEPVPNQKGNEKNHNSPDLQDEGRDMPQTSEEGENLQVGSERMESSESNISDENPLQGNEAGNVSEDPAEEIGNNLDFRQKMPGAESPNPQSEPAAEGGLQPGANGRQDTDFNGGNES